MVMQESLKVPQDSIEAEFTLAATKAADIGFKINVIGEVTDAQIAAATQAATRAALRMMETRGILMVIRDDPQYLANAKAAIGIEE